MTKHGNQTGRIREALMVKQPGESLAPPHPEEPPQAASRRANHEGGLTGGGFTLPTVVIDRVNDQSVPAAPRGSTDGRCAPWSP